MLQIDPHEASVRMMDGDAFHRPANDGRRIEPRTDVEDQQRRSSACPNQARSSASDDRYGASTNQLPARTFMKPRCRIVGTGNQSASVTPVTRIGPGRSRSTAGCGHTAGEHGRRHCKFA